MKYRFAFEAGAICTVSLLVFGWIFIQPPVEDQLRSPKSAEKPDVGVKVAAKADHVPTVTGSTTKAVDIKIESVALQTPGQALDSSAVLLEVTATSLKMRSGPSSQADMIDVYARGAVLEKIGEQGKWLQVRSTDDGTAGWMFAEYLQLAN